MKRVHLSCIAALFLLTACGGGGGSAAAPASPAAAVAPTVSSVTPTASATAIATTSTVTASFSEALTSSAVSATTFTVSKAGSNIAGTVTYSDTGFLATFTPTASLALLTPYTATLTTGITSSAAVALAENYIWSFTTRDGVWGTAGLIETADAGDAYNPQVAFDPTGNAITAWRQNDGTRDNIYANRYIAGTGWGAAELIESDTGAVYDVSLAVDFSGNAIAVWPQSDGTRFNIWSNRYTAGTGWGTAVLIETDNAGFAYGPKVAVDPSGNAIAVWYQGDGTRYNIWANRYTVGIGWGTAALIETDDTGTAEDDPQIAFDPSGNAIAAWRQTDGTRYNIYANYYTAGTGWGTAVLIETDNSGHADRPHVAFDSSGNAIAVWSQNDGTRWNVWANRYTAGTGWGTAELIETDNAGGAYYPRIAFDSSGNAIAAWSQNDGTRNNIWANRYTAGTGWGTAALIETDDAGNASSPQIAFDSNDNAIAVWYQNDATRWNIYANRYTAGTGWGTAALIETDNAGSAYSPQIAVDSNGNAISVWYQSDGTRTNIWANRFE